MRPRLDEASINPITPGKAADRSSVARPQGTPISASAPLTDTSITFMFRYPPTSSEIDAWRTSSSVKACELASSFAPGGRPRMRMLKSSSSSGRGMRSRQQKNSAAVCCRQFHDVLARRQEAEHVIRAKVQALQLLLPLYWEG